VETAVGFRTTNLDVAAVAVIAVGLDGATAGAIVQAEAGAALLVLLALLPGARARARVSTRQAEPQGNAGNDTTGGAAQQSPAASAGRERRCETIELLWIHVRNLPRAELTAENKRAGPYSQPRRNGPERFAVPTPEPRAVLCEAANHCIWSDQSRRDGRPVQANVQVDGTSQESGACGRIVPEMDDATSLGAPVCAFSGRDGPCRGPEQ
jgi:hypothetical protein